jgi:hypothetical protein
LYQHQYPRRTGSTAAVWTDETADRTTSEMAFEQIGLTPFELATFTDISNELQEDNAYNLEGELVRILKLLPVASQIKLAGFTPGLFAASASTGPTSMARYNAALMRLKRSGRLCALPGVNGMRFASIRPRQKLIRMKAGPATSRTTSGAFVSPVRFCHASGMQSLTML